MRLRLPSCWAETMHAAGKDARRRAMSGWKSGLGAGCKQAARRREGSRRVGERRWSNLALDACVQRLAGAIAIASAHQ